MELNSESEPGSGSASDSRPEVEPQPAGSYEWRYADEAGVSTPGPAVAFDTRESAERWLAENYRDLADDGITAVSLFDGNGVVFGPMPLDG